MRLVIYSDLHQEWGDFNPPPEAHDADLVILAGDIEPKLAGLEWAARTFPGQPVVYVAGNHEYYGSSLGLLSDLKVKAARLGISFLEQQELLLSGVRILGATLWSGFDLGEGEQKQHASMLAAQKHINDFYEIREFAEGPLVGPQSVLKLHQQSVAWLDEALSQPFDGKTIVVTHFPPVPACLRSDDLGSDVACYYANDLSWLLEKHQIDLWCHGHSHINTDIEISGCRIVSNQLGWPGRKEFEKLFVVEV